MDQAAPIEEKKSFLHNDRLLVCSMLGFYAFCILGLAGAAIWGLDRRNRQISANATSTAFAVATRQAQSTATAVARMTEQTQYKYIDPFNDNSQNWATELVDDEYMKGSLAINGGIYVWDVQEIKQTFVYWSHFHRGSKFANFDVYVDSRVASGEPGNVCNGFVFRTASFDWEQGAYVFSVCNDSYFYVNYYKQEKWETIADWQYSSAFRPDDWNRLEINARGDHFTFIINGEVVNEVTDDRLSTGGLALLVEVREENPVTIWFDNFGLQPR